MSEQYYFGDNNSINVKFDYFVDKVFNKHKEDYGAISASQTRERVRKIYVNSMANIMHSENHNVLLIGKVQSGKTSNLELFTAMAFDNGYKCVIIYGGYDNKLLSQTSDRFRKTFDINDNDLDSKEPELFSTDDGEVETLYEDVLDKIIELGKPIIFVSMKRPVALKKINDVLDKLASKNIKAFIIDDEGDQASLNTEFKKGKKSATYYEIETMKNKLQNPLYLSVTATPQANVLLGAYSILKPEILQLIEPGNGYTGADFFHTDDSKIITVTENETESLSNSNMHSTVYDAIHYFWIASAIMKKSDIAYSDMIIHTSRKNTVHKDMYSEIYNYLDALKQNIRDNNEEIKIQMEQLKTIYNEKYFSKNNLLQYPFEDLISTILNVIKDTHIILQDSQGKITQGNLKYKMHKIYVGGDLLQRGLTFKHLVTTYFTRWPKNGGNMDTTVQRARWFGYRSNFIDLCKVFTTEKIAKEFSALTESENDLWDQCYSIEHGEMSIDDIIIDADSSTLYPTRKNVANYIGIGTKAKFSKKWNVQKSGCFDKQLNESNTKSIDKLFNSISLETSSVGRSDTKNSCLYSYISIDIANDLIDNIQFIFDCYPFNKKELKLVISDKKIVIQKMFDLDGEFDIRERSFDSESGKIIAFHQGPDKSIIEEQKYKGDSHVIVDEEAVTFQIFRIRPKFNDVPKKEYDQYMFAIHAPNCQIRKGFIRDEFKTRNK